MNIPLGIFVIIVGSIILRGMESTIVKVPFNVIGLALLSVGVGCLQVLLDKGKELGWLASNEIVILGVISAIALVFLVIWELTDKNPIVELSLFKSRNFTIGTVSVSLAYMAYFGAIVLLPQLLQ
ncbi:multidrug resistance protein B, partial [Exiguobacterium mexicanum]